MHEGICYKKHFLKEVIFKIDLPSPLQDIEKGLPNKLTKAILSKFPISEPQIGKLIKISLFRHRLSNQKQRNNAMGFSWKIQIKEKDSHSRRTFIYKSDMYKI